jgi:hypothetical protein
MERLTAEQIADRAEPFQGRTNTVAINRAFRAQDESALFPVSGRFNATERAIRQTRANFRDMGEPCEGLAYALSLDAALSRIVNGVLS